MKKAANQEATEWTIERTQKIDRVAEEIRALLVKEYRPDGLNDIVVILGRISGEFAGRSTTPGTFIGAVATHGKLYLQERRLEVMPPAGHG